MIDLLLLRLWVALTGQDAEQPVETRRHCPAAGFPVLPCTQLDINKIGRLRLCEIGIQDKRRPGRLAGVQHLLRGWRVEFHCIGL